MIKVNKMKYRKKPIEIEAIKWNKYKDHSAVRHFRDSKGAGESLCKICNKKMYFHGWIKTLEGGHIVCPGDYIITGIKGEFYPCKPDIFEKTYEKLYTKEKK